MSGFTLVRQIKARPAIVFEALTTADGIASWWGPDALPVVSAEIDARVGGAYRVHFPSEGGGDHEAVGEILEIDPPTRLVMTYSYSFGGEPAEVGRVSHLEIVLKPIADGVELTFTHTGLADAVSVASHTRGWTGAFDKLVAKFGESAGRQP
jgi:uncharacterized protein YndB with AHSA1/START domain